jgi:hypothetical protein
MTTTRTAALLLAFAAAGLSSPAQERKPADDDGWPRSIELPEGTITIYQPQSEKLEGDKLTGRAAFSAKAKSAAEPVFGAFWFTARLMTDRAAHTVECLNVDVTSIRLPQVAEAKTDAIAKAIEREAPAWGLKASLDELVMSIEAVQKQEAQAAKLAMTPPKIHVREIPAVLILVDGPPQFRPTQDGKFQRVVNTPGFIVKDGETFWLKGGLLWFTAAALEGPWKKGTPPAALAETAAKELDEKKGGDAKPPATDPQVIVSTEPAELIVSAGPPRYEPAGGTGLLAISNSEQDLFREIATQKFYVVFSGRWFRAASLDGPWEGVRPDQLPADFAKLPPAEFADLLCHVPGTPQAKEALQDAQIPQTAAVKRKEAKLEVTYDGEPKFKKVEGTEIEMAMNSPFTVLKIKGRYYCCHEAVWWESASATGPWQLSTKVPEEVSTIPPEAPCYYVQYCYIYDTTPDYVYCGYLPGYVGCYPWYGCVVFGTGYWYGPWWGGAYWYPRPVTYGFGVFYSPVTGHWGVAFGARGPYGGFGIAIGSGGGWAVGIGGGCWGMRWGFSYTHIENNVDINRNKNLYGNRADTLPARDFAAARDRARPATQPRPSAGQQPARVSDRANDVMADRDGNVYRNTKDGWERNDGQKWSKPDATPASRESLNKAKPELDRTAQARERAPARTQQSRPSVSRGVPRGGGGGGRRR